MSAYTEGNKKYKLVAPDGGWGYMIFISYIINMLLCTIFLNCFGMLFNDFMIEIGMKSTSVTLFSGIHAISYAISGFFTSSLLRIMSRRKLAIMASLLLDVGLIGMVFAKSIVTFFICQGILPGISVGVIYNLSNSILNDYFVKKRMFAFSFVQLAISIVTIFFPTFVNWSLNEYGFRGTLILLAGISLNNIFASIIMHPVEWHMKRVEDVAPKEVEPLIFDKKTNVVVVKLSDENAVPGAEEKQSDFIEENENPSKFRKFADGIIDVTFFLKFVKSSVCLGISVCVFAEATLSIMLPQALYSFGWNQDMVAMAISLYSFGDLAMRIVLVCTSKWMLKIGTQELYLLGLIMAIVSGLGMICSEKGIWVYMYIVLMGISRCFVVILITIVISDVVPSENFTLAIGMTMLFCGATATVLGPAIGAIRDLTNSYFTAFFLLTSCFAIVLLFWSIELLYKRNKGKRHAQKATSLKSNQSIKGK